MDLDNYKELWHKENVSETPEISLEQQEEIHSPLDKIRKNMRIEFWYTILSYPVLFVLAYFYTRNIEQGNVVLTLLGICAIICGYYFLKFNTLYQRINNQEFSTFHQLLNLRYELVLNTELYKSYYIAYVPMIFSTYFVLYGVRDESLQHLFFVIVLTLVASFFLWLFGRFWLRIFYGKYIIQISNIIMELTEEEDDFVYDRKIINTDPITRPFERTSSFFSTKFGSIGVVFNIIFWMIIAILSITVLLFLAGILVGILQHI